MKTDPRPILCVLSVFLFSSPVQAKHKHQSPEPSAPLATPAPEPAALPAEAVPKISPDAPPSASLQPFLDAHLGKILAPLGVSAFAQPELIAGIKASYADGLAAAPDARKPAFALAQNVCDALTGAIAERQNAVAALRGALATRSSEAEQPRGGGEAVGTARDKDAFFVDSQKNTWIQRAQVLQQNIAALYLRERNEERPVAAWSQPARVAPAAAPATAATPSMSIPAPWEDPISGVWLWQAANHITVQGHGGAYGDRLGTWHYLCTTNAGRNYQFYWMGRKDWKEYLVLSSDGKTLDGKNIWGEHVVASRQ